MLQQISEFPCINGQISCRVDRSVEEINRGARVAEIHITVIARQRVDDIVQLRQIGKENTVIALLVVGRNAAPNREVTDDRRGAHISTEIEVGVNESVLVAVVNLG